MGSATGFVNEIGKRTGNFLKGKTHERPSGKAGNRTPIRNITQNYRKLANSSFLSSATRVYKTLPTIITMNLWIRSDLFWIRTLPLRSFSIRIRARIHSFRRFSTQNHTMHVVRLANKNNKGFPEVGEFGNLLILRGISQNLP